MTIPAQHGGEKASIETAWDVVVPCRHMNFTAHRRRVKIICLGKTAKVLNACLRITVCEDCTDFEHTLALKEAANARLPAGLASKWASSSSRGSKWSIAAWRRTNWQERITSWQKASSVGMLSHWGPKEGQRHS